MLKGIKVWNLRHFLDDVPYLWKRSFTTVCPRRDPLPALVQPAPGVCFSHQSEQWSVERPQTALRAHTAADLPGAPVLGTVAESGDGRKKWSPYHSLLRSLRKIYSREHGMEKQRQRIAPAWDLESSTPRHRAVWMWGLWDHRAFSLGHRRHFLWHDASWFTISSSSFPWLHWSRSGSPGASIYVEQNFVFRNWGLGTFWIETGNNPKLHVLLCGLYLCFSWNELRHSNSFQIAAKNQMVTLSLGGRSAHYRQGRPTPAFARNVLGRTNRFSPCFQPNVILFLGRMAAFTNRKGLYVGFQDLSIRSRCGCI